MHVLNLILINCLRLNGAQFLIEKMRIKISLILVISAIAFSCKPLYTKEYKKVNLVDSGASRKVQKLRKKLHYLSAQGFAVGHQDDTSYGIEWTHADSPDSVKSDIQSIVGDFPAVYGFDIAGIEKGEINNIDGVPFETMRELMIDAYKKGGIITVSWHADNPVSGSHSWDKTPSVSKILSDSIISAQYDQWLTNIAGFISSVRYRGSPIPIIFRPWHEMNGSWFWWGEENCHSEEYQLLWKRTVITLRDQHKLNNLLYVYSPNTQQPDDDYLEYYPGDDFVDIFGIDIYDFGDSAKYVSSIIHDLELIRGLAIEKQKLYAFTETGLEKIPRPGWFSKVLYPALENSGIAWVLFWRNHTVDHHYVPYRGHSNEKDFQQFEAYPKTYFLKDLQDLTY